MLLFSRYGGSRAGTREHREGARPAANGRQPSALWLLVLSVLGWLAAGPLAAAAGSQLIFLGNENLAPYVWRESGKAYGLAVDLAEAAAAKAGLAIRIEATNWPAAQLRVAAGDADALLHINPSPEREAIYDFSEPLLESRFVVFRLHSRVEIQDLATLSGRRVAVEDGGLPMRFLNPHADIRLVVAPSWKKAFEMLTTKQVDAVVVDQWVGELALAENHIRGVTGVGEPLLTSVSRIAVRKGNRELLARINAGLAAIAADGTREHILEKWRGKETVYVPREEVHVVVMLGIAGGAALLLLAIAYAHTVRRDNRRLGERQKLLEEEIRSRELSEETLRRSERFTAAVIETAGDVIVVLDAAGRVVRFNRAGELLTGFSRDELEGRAVWDCLVPPESADAARRVFEGLLQGGPTHEFEDECLTHDGRRRLLAWRSAVMRDDRGHITHVVALGHDVTVQQALQAAVAQSEARFRALVETTSDCIWECDAEGRFTYLSPNFESLLGVPPASLIGLTPADLPMDEGSDADALRHRPSLNAQAPVANLEYVLRHADGRSVIVEVNAVPVFGPSGAFEGMRGVTRDVTARRRSEDALRNVLEEAADFIGIADATGHLQYLNPAARGLLGIDEKDLSHIAIPDLVAEAAKPRLATHLETLRRTGQPERMEWPLVARNGEVRTVDIQGKRLKDGRFLAIGRDLTEKRLVEAELEAHRHRLEELVESRTADLARSEARYRNLYGSLQDPFVIVDMTGHIVECNDAYCALVGYGRDELARLTYVDLTPARWHEMEAAIVAREVLPHGYSANYEKEYRRKDGTIVPIELRAFLTLDAARRPTGMCAVVRDIRPRKEAEARLDELLKQQQAILDNASIGIAYLKDRRFVWCNRQLSTMFGYETDELNNQPTSLIYFHGSDADWVRDGEMANATMAAGHPWVREFPGRRKDGSRFWARLASQAVDPTEPLEGVIACVDDITTRKLAEEARELAHREALAASRAKTAFLANMSHEIRTPINGMLGMGHLLRRTALDARQAGYVDKMEASGRHLLAVVSDILDLAKIEEGKMALQREEFSLSDLFQGVADMFDEPVRAKGLQLRFDVDGSPGFLVGDRARLAQGLVNYVGNALKFTDRGGITVRCQLVEDADNDCLVRFEVEDTGIGIDAETQERLFASFEQGDHSMTRKYGGTGLGLAITRKLAELHGGSAGVRSEPGQGSLFWFTARLEKGSGQGAQAGIAGNVNAEKELRNRFAGARILLAEDNPVNQVVARSLLEGVGLVVDLAEDGQAAIDLASTRGYRAILMDMQMPGMGGLDATRAIRALAGHDRTPILGLTANAFAEDRAQCLAAGMDDYISKPVLPEKLFETLLKWLSQTHLQAR